MAQYYDFAGQRIIIPGSYTQRLFPKDQGAGSQTGLALVLGEATKGGIPYNAFTAVDDVINVVEGQAQALNVFGGGDLYYGAEFFLTPTKDARFNSPSQANCIVVNQMTQATTTIKGTGAVDTIDVSYNKYGTDGNTAAVKPSSGSNTGKLLELIYKGEEVIKTDDVSLELMNIQYVGSGSACTMEITATTLTTVETGGTTGNLAITLAEYESMGSLINYINNQANYTCLLNGTSDEKTTVFDVVAAGTDIKTSAFECVGIVEAIIRELNATGVVTAALSSGATRIAITDLSEFQYFTGGTVSAATTADWTAALVKLENYNLDSLVIMSGSETVHLLVQDHNSRMNAVKIQKYRQSGFGSGAAVNTRALRVAEMKALNSAYIEYGVSSFKRYDYVNKVADTSFAPYYLYAMIAGLRYSNNVGMDVVFKYLNILSTPEISNQDMEKYAAAGATIVQNVLDVNNINNFEIKVNNTTYQGSQVTRTNPAVVYEINKLTTSYNAEVIEQIRSLNTVANSVIISKISNWILTYLFPTVFRDNLGWITDGPNGQQAFANVSFTQQGELFRSAATLTMSLTPRFTFNLLTFITPGQIV